MSMPLALSFCVCFYFTYGAISKWSKFLKAACVPFFLPVTNASTALVPLTSIYASL